MLILCRFHYIGLQLLFLTHIVNSFVLLTANVEDVKKLARKFVSDSLADKIADFIAKATQDMGTSVSGEKVPEDTQVSEENNMYNVERHGFESAAQDVVKSKEENSQEKDTQVDKDEISESASVEEKNQEVDSTTETTTVKPSSPKSRYVKVESKINQQYAYPMPTEKKSKISEEDEKYEKSKEASKYLEENLVVTSTIKTQPIKKVPQKKAKKGRPYRLLANLNSLEENEMTAKLAENNDTIDEFSENLLFNQKRAFDSPRKPELTTGKSAYEFDQYDSKRYKNSAILATSGPVSLLVPGKKVSDNWWEKDLPSRRHDEKDNIDNMRKSWF
uniref:Uncharacterized protein n=1 Tax=Heliothis virescens TaxID=7102 RepID=A0A2A4JEB4_HELVI